MASCSKVDTMSWKNSNYLLFSDSATLALDCAARENDFRDEQDKFIVEELSAKEELVDLFESCQGVENCLEQMSDIAEQLLHRAKAKGATGWSLKDVKENHRVWSVSVALLEL